MKLTERELWLMRQAFNDGVCDDNFDVWLYEGAADGVTVADVLAKNSPPDTAIADAVAAEREACAAVCESCLDGDSVPSEWDEAALWCARTIRARTKQ